MACATETGPLRYLCDRYDIGKRCYGFKTDTRAVEFGLEMNPMISGCMIKIFKNYDGDKLVEEIKQYLSKNKL